MVLHPRRWQSKWKKLESQMTFWYYESDVFRYDPVLPATRFYFRGVDGGFGETLSSDLLH